MGVKTYISFSVLMVASVGAAWSQAVSVGVKGGIPLLDTLSSHDESRPYIVGPFVEIRLPAGFAIEADALYRRVGNSNFGSLLSGANLLAPDGAVVQGPYISTFSNRQRGNSWEFPLLGKYYFRTRALGWQPFLGSGFALRTTVGFHADTTRTVVAASGTPTTTSFQRDFRPPLDVGAVVSAGVRFHAGRLALAPEFRYTRWGGVENPLNRNEAGALLGISF